MYIFLFLCGQSAYDTTHNYYASCQSSMAIIIAILDERIRVSLKLES